MSQKFKTGDEVQHKSGGPKMVVKNYDPTDGLDVTCEYCDKNNNFVERSFHQDTLKKWDGAGPRIIRTTI